MQTVYLPIGTRGNPAHLISSMPVCNRTILIARALLPCADRSRLWLCREMVAASVLTDVPDRIKHLKCHLMSGSDSRSRNLLPALPIPSHFLSENVGGYKNEGKHDWPLQQVFDYGDLF